MHTTTRDHSLLLNCDLGEGLDALDAQVMPHLDQANIACGGHAGNNQSMVRTLQLAKQYQVSCGAHPSYPDRTNFGRVSLAMTACDLTRSLKQQIQSLITIANTQSTPVSYIKPHGALYNDCSQPAVLKTVLNVAAFFGLPVMLNACDQGIAAQCQQAGIGLIAEAFADRGYNGNGSLIKRGQPNALLNTKQSIQQVKSLYNLQGLYTADQQWLKLQCQSLCVHSDTPNAVATIQSLKGLLT